MDIIRFSRVSLLNPRCEFDLPETGLLTIYFPLSWGHRATVCASLICVAARVDIKTTFSVPVATAGLVHIIILRPAVTHLTFMEKTAES